MAIGGAVMAVASTVALPWVIVKMPADYFSRPPVTLSDRGPLRRLWWLLRNLLALVLLLCGVAMLVLPGQGLLTILVAIGVSSFPGKYRLERAIMRRPSVYRSCNWIRRRYGRPPLDFPASD